MVPFDPKVGKYEVLFDRAISLGGRVFTNDLGDWGSISGWVIPKTQKRVVDTSLLNTQHYKLRINGKVEQSSERSSLSLPHTPWCITYWKRSLDYGCQLYLYLTHRLVNHWLVEPQRFNSNQIRLNSVYTWCTFDKTVLDVIIPFLRIHVWSKVCKT